MLCKRKPRDRRVVQKMLTYEKKIKREFVGTGVPDCPRKQRTKGTKEENKKREFVGTPVPTKNNKSPRFTGVFIIG